MRPSPEKIDAAMESAVAGSAAPAATGPAAERWIDVCAVDDIVPGTGAAALVDGKQVALVRLADGETFFAVGHFDPFSKAFVIARGIVGDRGGIPKIASPIFKQNFDLRTGQCLDDAAVCLPTWPVRVAGGRVEVLSRTRKEVSHV